MSNKEDVAKQLEDYKMGPEAKGLISSSQILLIVGVAGAGKNAIIKKLIATGRFRFMISHTTREPRTNFGVLEQHGREFYFIDWDEAKRLVDARNFIEAKIVHRKNMYATSIDELKKAKDESKVATTDIDIQGVEEYKKIAPHVKAIFVLPPDFKTWQERLLARYKDNIGHEVEILERLETAEEEFKRALEDGYLHFVVNDNLDDAVKEIEDFTFSSQEKDQAPAVELAKKLLQETEDHLSKNR